MANKFNKGDVVVLKSGGPPMTIDALPGGKVIGFGSRDAEYFCRWFKGATADHGFYAEHLLLTYVPPAKK